MTGDLYVGLQQVTTRLNNGTTITVLNQRIKALIDMSVSELWMPQSVCDAIAQLFGLMYYPAADRYLVSDSVHASLTALNPTFTLQIGGADSDGLAINIDLPYAAFDLAIGYPLFVNATRYFPIRRAANDSQYALGRVFLQEVYLTADWEHNIANISQAAFSNPAAPQDIVTIAPKDDSLVRTVPKHKGLAAGAIAGIVIGALLVLALIGAFFFMRRRRQRAAKKNETPYEEYYGSNEKEATVPDDLSKPLGTVTEEECAELEGTRVEEMEASEKSNKEIYEMESPPAVDEKGLNLKQLIRSNEPETDVKEISKVEKK